MNVSERRADALLFNDGFLHFLGGNLAHDKTPDGVCEGDTPPFVERVDVVRIIFVIVLRRAFGLDKVSTGRRHGRRRESKGTLLLSVVGVDPLSPLERSVWMNRRPPVTVPWLSFSNARDSAKVENMNVNGLTERGH